MSNRCLNLLEMVRNEDGEIMSYSYSYSWIGKDVLALILSEGRIHQFKFRADDSFDILTNVVDFIEDKDSITVITEEFTFFFNKIGG